MPHVLRRRPCPERSARVVKAKYAGEVVAAKVIDLSQSAELCEAFLTEASRLSHLRHPHVVTLYGIALTRSSKGVVLMELCAGGRCA